MSNKIVSLWPPLKDITLPREVPPVVVLREQAEVIGQETNNIIEGQVTLEPVYSHKAGADDIENRGYIRHSLFVRAPLLNGYRCRILSVTHRPSELYPVTVFSQINADPILNREVHTESELRNAISTVLQSPEIVGLLGSLLAQSGFEAAA